MSKHFTSFKANVGTEVGNRKWFISRGVVPLGLALLLFVAIGALLVYVAADGWRSVYPRWNDVVLVGLAVAAFVNAAIVLGAMTQRKLWRRRSRDGNVEAERWEAFRRYLTDFPRLQEAPPATLALWERLLVYGIAFGIAERVLQAAHLAMPEELARPRRSTGSRPVAGSAPARRRWASATSRRDSGRRSPLRLPAREGLAAASPVAAAEVAAAGAGAPGRAWPALDILRGRYSVGTLTEWKSEMSLVLMEAVFDIRSDVRDLIAIFREEEDDDGQEDATGEG